MSAAAARAVSCLAVLMFLIATVAAPGTAAGSLGAIVARQTGEPLAAPAPGDSRPNVVVVLTDDMRADDLVHLPRTRRLMLQRGMKFTQAISPHPLCCPARAELVTGQYAQNNGVQHNSSAYGGWRRLDNTRTIATSFRDGGYHTAMIGKYLNGYHHSRPDEPGWHLWEAVSFQPTDYYTFGFHDGTRYTDDYVTTRIEERTNGAVRTLSAAERPFLVFANHVAPHDRQPNDGRAQLPPPAESQYAGMTPRKAPPFLSHPGFLRPVVNGLPKEMRQQTDRAGHFKRHGRAYYTKRWTARIRALQSVDGAVESLYRTLEETGELDNTYVIFTSDNGYGFGEHRLYRKNLLTKESLRIPMLVSGPGIASRSKSSLAVGLVDVVATITDLAGVRFQTRLDGASFAPTLRHKRQKWRDTSLIQTGNTRTKTKFPGWGMRGVRTGRYTYARDVNRKKQELLFDRRRDRFELVNAAKDPRYRPVVRELRRRTNKLSRCAGRSCTKSFGAVPEPMRLRDR